MGCGFEAAVDAWLALRDRQQEVAEVADFPGAEAARQRLVDAADCAHLVHPKLVAEWLSTEPGDRSGVGTFEITAYPADLWAAIDGLVLPTPIPFPSGPHLVQLGRVGSDRPVHAAFLDLRPGTSVVWAVADLGDDVRAYGCDDLDSWLDDAARAADADARGILALAPTLRTCPAYGAEHLTRWSTLAVAASLDDPIATGFVKGRDPRRWKRHRSMAAASRWLVPSVLVAAAGATAVVLATPGAGFWYYGPEDHDWIVRISEGAALGIDLAALGQAVAQRGVGASSPAVGIIGLLSANSMLRDDVEETRPLDMGVVLGSGLTQWWANEVAWAKFRKREREREQR